MRLQTLLRLSAVLSRFDGPLRNGVRAVMEPRKPRHRALRALLAVTGVVLLGLLAAAAIAIGTVVILAGLVWRLLRRTPAPAAPRGRVLDGSFRVVPRPLLSR